MKKTFLSLSIFMLAMLLLLGPAYADTLNFTLTNPIQTGTPNATLTFDATVSAPLANSGTLFLNGDNFNVSLAGAIFDDTGFLFDFPLSLDPGGSFTGTLFTVTLPRSSLPAPTMASLRFSEAPIQPLKTRSPQPTSRSTAQPQSPNPAPGSSWQPVSPYS
jgi:hypothetical protein